MLCLFVYESFSYKYGSVSAGREKWPFNVIFLDALASLDLKLSVGQSVSE